MAEEFAVAQRLSAEEAERERQRRIEEIRSRADAQRAAEADAWDEVATAFKAFTAAASAHAQLVQNGIDNRAQVQHEFGKRGWTKTVRPPVSYTNALKLTQMTQYGETGSPSDYEEDHFIPLELGGAPKNPKNLWPEPRAQSKLSDPLETKLKRQVCKGLLKLAKARAAIRKFKNANG